MNISRTISHVQWSNEGIAKFGRDPGCWLYSCPNCGESVKSFTGCDKCKFSNLKKTDHRWTVVKFHGGQIPVFPFAEVKA